MHKLRGAIRQRLMTSMTGRSVVDAKQVAAMVVPIVRRMAREGAQLTKQEEKALVEDMIDEVLGLGPLERLLQDPNVTEIMVNGPFKVFVERNGVKQLSGRRFDDLNHLRVIIQKLVRSGNYRLDESQPYVDLSLSNGSRVNIVIAPVGYGGPYITIRKFGRSFNSVNDLVANGTLSRPMAFFLCSCIKGRINIMFSGATGSGKTTTMEVLSEYIPKQERIVIIEDTVELQLRQDHVVRLLTRGKNLEGRGEITARELLNNCLRMRPSRILLGEIRGAEALEYLQVLSSGHDGSLAIIHAASPEDVAARLETLVLFAGMNLPVSAIRAQVASGLNLIVQQVQLPDGSRKISRITEVVGLDDGGRLVFQDIYRWELLGPGTDGNVSGRFVATGWVPRFLNKVTDNSGIKLPQDLFEPEKDVDSLLRTGDESGGFKIISGKLS